MTDSSIIRPGSPSASLEAPLMSTSSSSTSLASKMWSAETSRRGSNASSVAPSIVTTTKEDKTAPPPPVSEDAPPPAVSEDANIRAPLVHTNDPLCRAYPKPEGELDVAEALAREPLRWSLNHWRKNARDVHVPASAHPHSDLSKKRFQDTKADLMRSFAAMQLPATKK